MSFIYLVPFLFIPYTSEVQLLHSKMGSDNRFVHVKSKYNE